MSYNASLLQIDRLNNSHYTQN